MMLAFLSFVCAVCLAVFISARRIRISVPRLSIIIWLFGYNLVHGINAAVWSGNVDIHAPVWCDIVTNVMLGANLALPAAILCISRQLELLSSTRTIPFHPTVVRNRLMFDIFMCYLLPMIYILLHLVVQNHRFDLVENFGCSASVDPSLVGISLVWIPPLLICSISIVFLGLSIRNALRHRLGRLSIHIESRSSTMTSSSFKRYLVIYMTTTIAAGLVSLLSTISGPSLHPWSWATVHASMSEVHIVSSPDQLGSIKLAWWGGFVVTVLYLLLSYSLGEETRDILKWIKRKITREAREERFDLPMHRSKNTKKAYQLRSGWDEMLDDKAPRAKAKPSITISSTCSSPISEDDDFKTSTLSYLGSPTAKTLGLSGAPVPQKVAEMPQSPTSSPVSPVSPTFHKAGVNPVCAPPNSALPSLPESCYGSRSRPSSNLFPKETSGSLTPLLSLFPTI